MSDYNRLPVEGAIWLCGACGRTCTGAKSDIGDESCYLNAVMVWTASIRRDDRGQIVGADAVRE